MTLDMNLPFGTTTACELPKCVLYDGISVLQLTFILIEDEDRSTEDIGVPPPYPYLFHAKNLGNA